MNALVAEDDPYTRRALVEILQNEGFTVQSVCDGRSAVQVFREFKPELVCLDVMMPVLSGYDVCKEIRQLDNSVAILFISAKTEEIDTVLGLELGGDDFIVKPFGVRELVARVRSVLRRVVTEKSPEQEQHEQLNLAHYTDFTFAHWHIKLRELGAYSVDIQLDKKYDKDCFIDLSQREALILLLLHIHKGEIVRREDFFRYCWNYDAVPASRTLDQHIVSLRKKIEKNPKNPQCIQTVQGLGYRYQ